MEWKKYKGLQVSETGIVRIGTNVIKQSANGYPLNDKTRIMHDELMNQLFSVGVLLPVTVVKDEAETATLKPVKRKTATLNKTTSAETATLKRGRKKGIIIGKDHHKFIGYYIINGQRYESAEQAHQATGIRLKTIIEHCKLGMSFESSQSAFKQKKDGQLKQKKMVNPYIPPVNP